MQTGATSKEESEGVLIEYLVRGRSSRPLHHS